MDESKDQEVIGHHGPKQRIARWLADFGRPFRWVGGLLKSGVFWFALLVISNILFVIASLWQPLNDAIEEMVTFGQASNEMIETIKAIEDSSGVEMEEFISVAFENVRSLRIDVANTEARARRIEAALVQPLIHTWRYEIPQENADCLGGIEALYRLISAQRILSSDGFREASFLDGAGYAHSFSAICFGNDLAVFATGYNQAGTEEIFSDLINAVTERWPSESEDVP